MPDTQQLATPETPPPGPPAHRRTLITLIATVVIIALVAVIAVLTRDNGDGADNADDSADSGPTAPRTPGALPDPATRSNEEAAIRGNWPLTQNDEFNGDALDTSTWSPYTGETTDGVGRHRKENLSVADGMLTVTSTGLTSGGLSWEPGQMYGRWEVRARAQAGSGFGPVMLLWPDAEDWPEGGEIDFMEIPKGDRQVNNFTVHYGEDNSQNATQQRADFTQWHNYAVEWTPDHIAGFLDGNEVFRTTEKDQLPPRPMHLGIQQDIGPYGTDWIPAPDASTPDEVKLQVDWVRIYGR